MQDPKSYCPKIKTITDPLRVDQTQDDLTIPQVTDISKGILARVHQC